MKSSQEIVDDVVNAGFFEKPFTLKPDSSPITVSLLSTESVFVDEVIRKAITAKRTTLP